jgi:hypothetical protein
MFDFNCLKVHLLKTETNFYKTHHRIEATLSGFIIIVASEGKKRAPHRDTHHCYILIETHGLEKQTLHTFIRCEIYASLRRLTKFHS